MTVAQYLRSFFFCCLTAAFLSKVHGKVTHTVEPAFLQGEWLQYQVHYSFIHAGTATMSVDKQLHKLNNHLCYKIQVEGSSTGPLGLLGFNLLDRWESYLDADDVKALRPHRSVTHLQENGYVRKEQVNFDYQSYQAKIEVAESSNNMEYEVTYYPISNPNIKDLIGGYYALRSIDTQQLKPGDKLSATVLYDQQLYENIDILFLGKKTIVTKLGKTSALVFAPLVPIEGTIFSGEHPVEAYISNDINKVPLKLKVNLVVGAVEIELTDYKGLREPIHFQPS